MNIVLLTRPSPWGTELLRQMKSKSIAVKAVVLEHPNRFKIIMTLIKRWGLMGTTIIILRRLLGIVVPKTRASWLKKDCYYRYSESVYTVGNFNGKQCEQLLIDIKPDLIVLATSPILRGNIIAIPNIGILNAHPGLLPKYRGINTVEWAIYNGDEIGVTIHFVDAGVDTGNIITQKVISIEQGDNVQSLKKRVWSTASELMVEAIVKIAQGKHIPVIPQRIKDGKQYYRMSRKVLDETKRKLSEKNRMPRQ